MIFSDEDMDETLFNLAQFRVKTKATEAPMWKLLLADNATQVAYNQIILLSLMNAYCDREFGFTVASTFSLDEMINV